jgi:hypothetical protein
MSAHRFTTVRHLVRYCEARHDSVRSIVTDLEANRPRVFVICATGTFVIRPDDVPELAAFLPLSEEILVFLEAHDLLERATSPL